MEAHAETPAEIEEVTSDTGRVLGPILVGIPFALAYTGAWWGAASVGRRLARARPGPAMGVRG